MNEVKIHWLSFSKAHYKQVFKAKVKTFTEIFPRWNCPLDILSFLMLRNDKFYGIKLPIKKQPLVIKIILH